MSRYVKLAGQSSGGGAASLPSTACFTTVCSPCYKSEYPQGEGTFAPSGQWVTIAKCLDWQGTGFCTNFEYPFKCFKHICYFFYHHGAASWNYYCMRILDDLGNCLCSGNGVIGISCHYMTTCCHCEIGQSNYCMCGQFGGVGSFYKHPGWQGTVPCSRQCSYIGWQFCSGWQPGYHNWSQARKGYICPCIPHAAAKLHWENFGGFQVMVNQNLNNYPGGGCFSIWGLLDEPENVEN